jgi:HAD superfamily hydrolase (TIGR01509 family)
MVEVVKFSDCELVIFDCDGVLVDSELLLNESLAEISSELGWPCTVNQAGERFRGRTNIDILASIEEALQTTLNVDFQQMLEDRVFKTFERDLLPMPGVLTVLNELLIPFCAATNSIKSEANFKLRVTGLLPWFNDRVYTSDQVERPKPAPDLYLYAANQMNAPIDKTIVVEDSSLGVRSALAADMKVVGLAASQYVVRKELEEAGAHVVIDDIRELLPLVH